MHIKLTVAGFLALTCAFTGEHVHGQSADHKTTSSTPACTDIDFWAGEWAVRRIDGTKDATVNIKLSNAHCYAIEYWNYTKLRGAGHAICVMAYSNQEHNWEYLCGDAQGDRYRFSGGSLIGNELRFGGDDMAPGITQRFSYFNLPDGRIRELELESSDGGKTWKTNVDVYWSRGSNAYLPRKVP
jgi:hypothetical protein